VGKSQRWSICIS